MNLASDGSNQPSLQLCIFDDRRGDREGQEADKVLGYYPNSVTVNAQTSLVGLAQAFLSFTSTFEPVSLS